MIIVTFFRKDGAIVKVDAKGHALSGKYGEDIVCAAVSALLQTAQIGLTDYAGIDVQASRRSGRMSLEVQGLSGESAVKAESILETTRLGLISISLAHPQNLKIVGQED